MRGVIKSYRDLEVYQLSYALAMDVYRLTKSFPKEEQYSLTAQIRNSSRSVPANIAEGWSKRRYENIFKRQLTDSIGSTDETVVWLDFGLDCGYFLKNKHDELVDRYNETGKKLYKLIENWRTF